MLNAYLNEFVTPDIQYFSLLRPWYELTIAKEFSNYHQYYSVFSSCNRNFSTADPNIDNHWCGVCPKCVSVFLLFSPFIPKDQLIQIFGKNLFTDQKLTDIYRGLLGLTKIKPFECVGTVAETRLALYLTWQKKDYQDSLVMKMFEKEILPKLTNPENLKTDIFKINNLDNIPDQFKLIFQNETITT